MGGPYPLSNACILVKMACGPNTHCQDASTSHLGSCRSLARMKHRCCGRPISRATSRGCAVSCRCSLPRYSLLNITLSRLGIAAVGVAHLVNDNLNLILVLHGHISWRLLPAQPLAVKHEVHGLHINGRLCAIRIHQFPAPSKTPTPLRLQPQDLQRLSLWQGDRSCLHS